MSGGAASGGMVGERRKVLPDGTTVLVRPVQPSDRQYLVSGFATLSPESKRTRFFTDDAELDEEEIRYLTEVDQEDHVALAVFRDDVSPPRGVAVGRYVRDLDDPTSAELAITVVDEEQGHGIGTMLVWELAWIAVQRGIRRLVSYAMWENDTMIDLLVDHGATTRPAEPGIARVELDVTPLAVAAGIEEADGEEVSRRAPAGAASWRTSAGRPRGGGRRGPGGRAGGARPRRR